MDDALGTKVSLSLDRFLSLPLTTRPRSFSGLSSLLATSVSSAPPRRRPPANPDSNPRGMICCIPEEKKKVAADTTREIETPASADGRFTTSTLRRAEQHRKLETLRFA